MNTIVPESFFLSVLDVGLWSLAVRRLKKKKQKTSLSENFTNSIDGYRLITDAARLSLVIGVVGFDTAAPRQHVLNTANITNST